MSSEAVARRLQMAGELRDLALSLRRAKQLHDTKLKTDAPNAKRSSSKAGTKDRSVDE